MPSPRPVRRAPLLAVAALAGTTAVTGTLVAATPAVAVPVAIAEYLVEVPEGSLSTGGKSFFTPVTLTNTDTAYGIHEDQPVAPVGELAFDDEGYAVAEPVDDPATGWENVVGEKVDDSAVYWEPGNAALAGYILSVFGPTDEPDEALAVQWAVRSLSTAELPQPDGLEPWHLDRAAFLIQDARENVPALVPQDGYPVSVSSAPDGRPDTLRVTMPEASYATTVTLSGSVTFADGTTTRTFTGGDRDQHLELAVPVGVTEGELTAELTATMPSAELTVLAHEQYRDLLIAGQERTVEWGVSTAFEFDTPAAPDEVPGEETTSPDDDGTGDAPADQDIPTGNDIDDDGVGGSGSDTGSGSGAAGPAAGSAVRDRGAPLLEVVPDAAAEQKLTATLEAFVLFDEQTTTSTEVVTETTMTAGAGGAMYADPAMANTGMGAVPAAGERSGLTSVVLVLVAAGAGLGAWLLRRRPAADQDRSA